MNAHEVIDRAGVQGRVGRREGTRGRSRRRGGFTLLEAALALVILGVGVLALIESQAMFFAHNRYSTSAATGMYLCTELRERMRRLPRHDPVTGLYFEGTGQSATLQGWGPETSETSFLYYNDLDDYDGATFGAGATFAGPIDSAGLAISEVMPDGTIMENAEGEPVSMQGWSQRVRVEKVLPFDTSTAVASNATQSSPPVAVDQFPLRVTITAFYQGPLDAAPREMARLVFIQP
ncbi:MAG: prepilin-type N-terminal cleavage/methylation domain-containing protein [Phycisphaerales bacterium]|jgi:type II secretory pathway pseudopilin PulG|nr:prepilin-type N-terminal cleavage/methylation domain-containing protein [Phycisphaeraceae bacterium]